VERTARQGILWTDLPGRQTEADDRHTIGQAVFGNDYRD
jgi:hypothetical protein